VRSRRRLAGIGARHAREGAWRDRPRNHRVGNLSAVGANRVREVAEHARCREPALAAAPRAARATGSPSRSRSLSIAARVRGSARIDTPRSCSDSDRSSAARIFAGSPCPPGGPTSSMLTRPAEPSPLKPGQRHEHRQHAPLCGLQGEPPNCPQGGSPRTSAASCAPFPPLPYNDSWYPPAVSTRRRSSSPAARRARRPCRPRQMPPAVGS